LLGYASIVQPFNSNTVSLFWKSEPTEKLLELIEAERKNNPSIEFEVIVQQNETVLQIKGDAVKDFVNKLRSKKEY
jgi:hypothetical protein